MERSEVFQQLWTLKATTSTLIYVWRAMLDKLPTTINLFRKGVQLETYACPLCKRVDEIVQHLFINCAVVQEVWDACDTTIYCHFLASDAPSTWVVILRQLGDPNRHTISLATHE